MGVYVQEGGGVNHALGEGQSWQDVMTSRAINTIYQNTTGRAIVVQISGTLNISETARLLIGETNPPAMILETIKTGPYNASYYGCVLIGIIPAGYYYKVEQTGSFNIINWKELR